MNDLFRAIFGIPYYDQHVRRMDKRPPNEEDDNRRNYKRTRDDDDDDDDGNDDMRVHPRGGFFGFPLFTDPVEIHKHFDRLVDEMNKAFGMFGFRSDTSLPWGDENMNNPPICNDHPEQAQECSLRDAFLKQPDCGCENVRPRDDFDAVMGNFEAGGSRDPNMEIQVTYPKVYSKSVYIQTVRRPDGTVETIKKVRDHTGNEETTITHSNVNDPPLIPPPAIGQLQDDQQPPAKEDSSGMSIFKKFFRF